MADEYIRLDTTIIAIDNLINEAATGTMARTLFKAKDTIYNQQRYVVDAQPVKWISVKDKLPEEAVKVLIYTEYNAIAYGFFTGAYYNNRPLFAITMNRNSAHSWYEEIRVSHWKPLPEPPKDGDKDNNVRNLTDEETAIYESWIESEAKDTGVNIMDGDTNG